MQTLSSPAELSIAKYSGGPRAETQVGLDTRKLLAFARLSYRGLFSDSAALRPITKLRIAGNAGNV
jgi:hypothetical protein